MRPNADTIGMQDRIASIAAPHRSPSAASRGLLDNEASPGTPAAPPAHEGHGWASMNIEGVGELSGVVVGFDTVVVVVALALPVDIVRGRGVVFALGIDGRTVQGLSGTTAGVSRHPDGRQCVAIRLNGEGRGTPGGLPSRRAKLRVPFDAKVDAMVVASRKATDKNYRFQAVDLSSRGLGAVGAREIATKSNVLLRFAVPPHRGATLQIRAVVAHLQRMSNCEVQVGFAFERVTAAQLTQVNNAIMHISHPSAAARHG